MGANGQEFTRMGLIQCILSRWWYAFPVWPPVEYDYDSQLKKVGYRIVPIEKWGLQSPKVDAQTGLKRCYELGQFPGCYRSDDIDLMDMRPVETNPCHQNLNQKESSELLDFLIRALENQIQILSQQKTGHKNNILMKDLEDML